MWLSLNSSLSHLLRMKHPEPIRQASRSWDVGWSTEVKGTEAKEWTP